MNGRTYFEKALSDFEFHAGKRNVPIPGTTHRQHMQDYALKAGLGMLLHITDTLEQIERNTRPRDPNNTFSRQM